MGRTERLGRLDDWINPIAVKEMRQAVKGKFITGMLLFFLVVQLTVIGGFLILQEDPGENFNLGRDIFMALLSVLLGACILMIPIYTGIRFSAERSDSNVDLFFITTLKPRQIIWGKLVSSLALVGLYFSASLPFLTLTYLLRGLDLPSMFLMLGLDFLIVVVCCQFAIMLATFPGKLFMRVIRFMIGLGVLVFAFSMTISISINLMMFGIGSVIGSRDFWMGAGATVLLMVLGTGLLFMISSLAISAPTSNRALGIRLYLFVTWLVTGGLLAAMAVKTGDEGYWTAWAVGATMVFAFHMFAAVCERLELGPRVRRTIPAGRLARMLVFPFYSGAAGGMVYSLLMFVLTFAVMAASFRFFPSALSLSNNEEYFVYTFVPPLYAFCYAMTAFLIRRLLFKRNTEPAMTALAGGILFLMGCTLPPLMAFLVNDGRWRGIPDIWFLANPYVVFWEEGMWDDCIVFSVLWAAVLLAVNAPWLIRRMQAFVPLRVEAEPQTQAPAQQAGVPLETPELSP